MFYISNLPQPKRIYTYNAYCAVLDFYVTLHYERSTYPAFPNKAFYIHNTLVSDILDF